MFSKDPSYATSQYFGSNLGCIIPIEARSGLLERSSNSYNFGVEHFCKFFPEAARNGPSSKECKVDGYRKSFIVLLNNLGLILVEFYSPC